MNTSAATANPPRSRVKRERVLSQRLRRVLSFEFWVLSFELGLSSPGYTRNSELKTSPSSPFHSELRTQNSELFAQLFRPTPNPELKTQNFESRLSRYAVPD